MNFLRKLSVVLLVVTCVCVVSCGDDDEIVKTGTENVTDDGQHENDPSGQTIITTKDALGKWKIVKIGNADWRTLSFNEDDGYIVFEKDGSYTTRKGGYHLIQTTGVSRYTVNGNDIQIYNQGSVIATFSFKEVKNNNATVSLNVSGETKMLVLEKQIANPANIYKVTLKSPKGLLGGGELLFKTQSNADAFLFNYFQIKGEETTFYFCTGKTGTLYLALRGRYTVGDGNYNFIKYTGDAYYSMNYINFPLREGEKTINLVDCYSKETIENAQFVITLQLVDKDEYYDSEDELEYPHAEHNLFKVETEWGDGTGSYTVNSLDGTNPDEIDYVITKSCDIITTSEVGRKTTH